MAYFTKPVPGIGLNYTHPLTRGLVAYYPMWEGAGEGVKDISGNGNHGLMINFVQGATSGWTGGQFGTCLRFDGVDDYVSVPSFSISGPLTISVWVNIPASEASGGYRAIVNGTDQDTLYKKTGVDKAYYHGITFSNSVIANGVWNHVVITRDASNVIRCYVNGMVDSVTGTFSQTQTINRLAQGGAGEYMNGLIDDVRIYNRALSADEVRQLYNEPYGNFLRWVSAGRLITVDAASNHLLSLLGIGN